MTADALTDAHVRAAIDAIVAELYARKHPQRFWEHEKIPTGDSTRQHGGYTAIVVLSLLHAGQSYQDPRLRDAVDFLATYAMEGTYATAVRASMWARLPERYHEKLAADARWLLNGFSAQAACWDYEHNPRTIRRDNSIRQFGALALWEASKRDVKVDRRQWARLEEGFLDMQLADGGWNYTGDGPATGSMTCAGLATLFITQDLLHAQQSVKLGSSAPTRPEQAIERGLRWMQSNFSPTDNPGKGTYFYYYLWGVERVGLASGFKTFGGRDWFREGAAELIRRVCKWDETSQTFTVHERTAGDGRASKLRTDDLAFALIFLSRGRVPVAINKLQFEGAWNNRPRDAANLTAWIRDNTETELNWQIVSFDSEPETWLDAPNLYVASHESLPWVRGGSTDGAGALGAELAKLKRYIDLGGLVLAISEGAGKAFAESVEAAGARMYPQYQWRELPEDHWAYSLHTAVKSRRPALRGLSNGVRELIILSPGGDLPATFQVSDVKQAGEFQTAMNIYVHASELNRPKPRLARRAGAAGGGEATSSSITIVRALHEGNWNPEPLALEVFSQFAAMERGVAVQITEHPLANLHHLDPPPQLVIVNGIGAHSFTSSQSHAIRTYVERGGTILFETPGGGGGFTESAEQMAGALFGRPIESMVYSRIISGEGLDNGANLARLEYRPFSMNVFGTRETSPRLRGMSLRDGGKAQLLFSREDISHGLLDQPRWDISGYAPQAARQLLANIIGHAMQP